MGFRGLVAATVFDLRRLGGRGGRDQRYHLPCDQAPALWRVALVVDMPAFKPPRAQTLLADWRQAFLVAPRIPAWLCVPARGCPRSGSSPSPQAAPTPRGRSG